MVKQENNKLEYLTKRQPQPSSLSLIARDDSYDRGKLEFCAV